MKPQEDEAEKETLATFDEEETFETQQSERGAQYYQSIVDEAHR
jgi:hypothetical protein